MKSLDKFPSAQSRYPDDTLHTYTIRDEGSRETRDIKQYFIVQKKKTNKSYKTISTLPTVHDRIVII